MKQKSELYFKDILAAIDRIRSYASNISLEELKEDRKTLDSILMNLLIIGEAVTQIFETLQSSHPNFPWANIKRFRNVVVHRYWTIDIQTIWDIIQNQIEPLEDQIKDIMNKEK